MGKFSITVSDRREDWARENPRLVALQCELDTPGYSTQTEPPPGADTPGYATQTTPVDTPGFAPQTEPPLTDTPGHGSPLTD